MNLVQFRDWHQRQRVGVELSTAGLLIPQVGLFPDNQHVPLVVLGVEDDFPHFFTALEEALAFCAVLGPDFAARTVDRRG